MRSAYVKPKEPPAAGTLAAVLVRFVCTNSDSQHSPRLRPHEWLQRMERCAEASGQVPLIWPQHVIVIHLAM